MSELSGQYGLLSLDGTTAVSTIRNWKINPKADNPKGVASNSGNAQVVIEGVTDFSGSWDFYGKSVLGFAVPGTAYTGYFQTQTKEISASLMVDSVTMKCDIEGGNILGGTVNFSGNGALTWATSPTSLTNVSVPAMFAAVAGKASWQPVSTLNGALGSAADIPDVRSWDLTISRDNKAFASSSTTGGHTGVVRKRVQGPLRAQASVNMYQGAIDYFGTSATLLTPGAIGILKLYVTSSTFYTLTYSRSNGVPINEDVEGAGPVDASINFDWSAYANISGTMTKGALTDPASVSIY